MVIVKISIKKEHAEIELKKEGITILTGPNGYGKTTILKIIHAFAIRNLVFFSVAVYRDYSESGR